MSNSTLQYRREAVCKSVLMKIYMEEDFRSLKSAEIEILKEIYLNRLYRESLEIVISLKSQYYRLVSEQGHCKNSLKFSMCERVN